MGVNIKKRQRIQGHLPWKDVTKEIVGGKGKGKWGEKNIEEKKKV